MTSCLRWTELLGEVRTQQGEQSVLSLMQSAGAEAAAGVKGWDHKRNNISEDKRAHECSILTRRLCTYIISIRMALLSL